MTIDEIESVRNSFTKQSILIRKLAAAVEKQQKATKEVEELSQALSLIQIPESLKAEIIGGEDFVLVTRLGAKLS